MSTQRTAQELADKLKRIAMHAQIAGDLLMEAHKAKPEIWHGWHDDALNHADIAKNELRSLASRLAASPVPAGWLPIETAPKDGTEFLGYRHGRMATSHCVPRDDCEMWVFGNESGAYECWPQVRPTHWMPLPSPPESKQ